MLTRRRRYVTSSQCHVATSSQHWKQVFLFSCCFKKVPARKQPLLGRRELLRTNANIDSFSVDGSVWKVTAIDSKLLLVFLVPQARYC